MCVNAIDFAGGDSHLYRYAFNSAINFNGPYNENAMKWLNRADQFFPGFGNLVTSPLTPLGLNTNAIREMPNGEIATRNQQGALYNTDTVDELNKREFN